MSKSRYTAARTEEEVGITCRIGNHERFRAVFKSRFSDFHVNEVDLNGKIVQLTSLSAPVERKSDYAEDDPEICEWIPEQVRNDIRDLQARLEEAKRNNLFRTEKVWKEQVFIKVTVLNKEQRTKIHRWMANFDQLCSETVDKDGDKCIVALFDNKTNRNRRRPAARAKYTHFTLYKEGVDTSEAIGLISKKLRIRPNFITFCGTKDKHGKTTQRMCLSNIDANRLVQISKEMKSIKLGNFEYLPFHLRLGDLKGNHFKILLRDVIGSSEEPIAVAVESLKTTGFVNYFGLQRFGSYEISTHAVGKKILQNKWVEAFDLILKPKNNDVDFMAKAKVQWFENRDPGAAIKCISNAHRSLESHLLHGLSKYYEKNDYIGVFQRIPRNTRHLYIHSFQSFLWNQVASFRINKMGLQPVVGDLVYVDRNQSEFDVEDILDEDSDTEADNGHSNSASEKSPSVRSAAVKALTEEDLPQYTIFDVVIPIQGTQIKIPDSPVLDFYNGILKKEGLEGDCFVKFKPLADQPKGAYRKLVIQPQNVSYQIRPYNNSDPVDTFIPSELDKLNQQEQCVKKSESGNATCTNEEVVNTTAGVENDKKCLIVEMSLPASSYATMALREIMISNSEEPLRTKAESDEDKNNIPAQVRKDEDEPEAKRRREDN